MKHLARRSPMKHAALTAVVAAAAPAPAPLKVGFVYAAPVGDAGWAFAHDLGRKHIEGKFGDRIKTPFVEKVPEGADAERVIRDLVAQGDQPIFATSFGFVASFPIPEVLRKINASTLGAQSVNPKITTKAVWVNTWFDPPKEAEAARSPIDAKADVLPRNTDSTAVLQTAEKNGEVAFGRDSDTSAFAPEAHLASCVLTWGPYYEQAVNDVLNNTWKTEVTKWGTKEGMNDIVRIVDSTGKEVLAKDAVADDRWKGSINLYVKGVEGPVPSGK